MFNFDIQKTQVFRLMKILGFPLFEYSFVLVKLFLYSFIISLSLVGFYFLGFVSGEFTIKIPLLMLVFIMISVEIYLFLELKIKPARIATPASNAKRSFAGWQSVAGGNQKIAGSLKEAILNPEKHNLADFLSIESCKIVEHAIKVCKTKMISLIPSEALFYSALVKSKDVQILIFRLGLDIKKLQDDLKNYLEKQPRQQKFSLIFSDSFQKTILESAAIASERGLETIGEKEMLVALAKHDQFFKKVLIQGELKEEDVRNITLWLSNLEESIKRSKEFWTKENLAKFGSLGKDFAAGFTVTLDQFSVDWREFAKNSIFNKIIGHEKEIEDLEIVLTKSKLSNALIIGEEGVGKKSIIQALAQRCYLETGLAELNDKRVVELDMVSIISRIQDQEKLEIILDQIFEEALAAGNVILVIDHLDKFVTQKSQKPGEIDISVILAKYLAIPNFQFVGITSFEGLHRKLEQSSAFLEYFRKIEVSEISEIETIRILQNLAISFEQKYKILILYSSIREIVNLSARYFPSLPFPKKAIDVLDEAANYVRSQKGKVLEPHHIAQIISDKTQIPVGKLEFREKSVLMNLENLIHQRIVNQQDAVTEISIAMRRARSGLSSKKRPMGTFLFLGPTGVGKTETAKALAEIYFGRFTGDSSSESYDLTEEKMIRIDMSEFQSISDIPRLIGAISPVEQQGLLTTPVRENPFSLVLLDEIEKAHPDILNLFLQVFDEGHITDGQGRKVIFTNTIIICTSNAGAELIFKQVKSQDKLEKDKLLDFFFKKGIFRPEFINRFDATVVFHPLTKENLMDITQIMLSDLAKNLKEKGIELIVTSQLKEKIVDLSYKPEFGAREMRRVIQDKIENQVAQNLLSDKITKGNKIEINPDNFEIIIIK